MLVVAALRFNSGFDYLSYYMHILEGGRHLDRYEPLSKALMRIAQATDPQIFFACMAAISVGFNVATILHIERKANISRLAIFALICLPVGYLDSFNFIRQICAASVFVYAFVRRDNWWIAIPLACLAVAIHFSAIVFVPALLVGTFWNPRFSSGIYTLAIASSFLCTPVIEHASRVTGLYSHYFTNHASSIGFKSLALFLAVGALMVFKRSAIRAAGLNNELNLFFVGLFLMAALSPYGTHLARISWYGIAVYPILIGAALARETLYIKYIAALFMAGAFLANLYFALSHPVWDGLNQFQWSPVVSQQQKLEVLQRFRHLADR